MRISVAYFLFVAFFLALVYGSDLVFIKTFGQRIVGTSFLALFTNYQKAQLFLGNFPVFYFLFGTLLMLWVWWYLIDWFFRFLGSMDREERKIYRRFWQAFAIALHLTLFIVSAVMFSKFLPEDMIMSKSPENALSYNPLYSLICR